MAWIKKEKKKVYKSIKERSDKDIQKIYQTKTWRELRKAYLMQHPLCEMCLGKDVVKPTQEIHHKVPISTGTTPEEMMDIAFDSNNLIGLCKECHHEIHKEMKSGFMRKNTENSPQRT